MSKRTNRRALRALKPTPFQLTRPFVEGVDVLEPLTFDHHGVNIPGHKRCHAVGLENGDCRQVRLPDSQYCYYHDKLQTGLCGPSVPSPEESDQRDGMALYPVWPLPAEGYVCLTQSPRRLPLAG